MTFTEWQGNMDWPLDADWKCEICGTTGLEWGFIHGMCRCKRCHAKYMMRHDGQRVTNPISLLKPKYKQAAKLGWVRLPLDEWTDDMWTAALEWAPDPADDQLDRQQMADLEPPGEFEQDPMNPCGVLDPRF